MAALDRANAQQESYGLPHRRRLPVGFTLIELLTVITILGILGAITIGAMSNAAGRGKADTSRNVVRMLSEQILDQYENYEDIAVTKAKTAPDVVALRKRIREEMPDSWADVAGPGITTVSGTTAAGAAYRAYKAACNPSSPYGGAECLYMIMTQSGLFPDFLSSVPSKFIGDIDKDGAFEFWDGWGRPISFIRWAPGAMPVSRRNADKYPDPLDPLRFDYDASDATKTGYAVVPLIFSPGKDESLNDPMSGVSGYGLISVQEEGWPDSALAVSGTTPCTYNPKNKGLIGAPDPGNSDAYRDNISNYDTLFQ